MIWFMRLSFKLKGETCNSASCSVIASDGARGNRGLAGRPQMCRCSARWAVTTIATVLIAAALANATWRFSLGRRAVPKCVGGISPTIIYRTSVTVGGGHRTRIAYDVFELAFAERL